MERTNEVKDLSIYMCDWCGARYAADDIPPWARGVEQRIVYKPIPTCESCQPDWELATYGGKDIKGTLRRRTDLPTSIGSIIDGQVIDREEVDVNS